MVQGHRDFIMESHAVITVKNRAWNQRPQAHFTVITLEGTGIAGKSNESGILCHELHIVSHIMVIGVNIDGIRLNPIIRYFGYRMFRGKIPFFHHQFIGIPVIHAAGTFEIIGSRFPAVHFFKTAYGFSPVIIGPFRFQTGGGIDPAHFSRYHIFLSNGIAIYIFCLVGVKHVPDHYPAHGIHVAGGIVIAHAVSSDIHGVFC